MQNDPFKRRTSRNEPKKTVILSKNELERLVTRSKTLEAEDERDQAIREEHRRRVKESKDFSASMSQEQVSAKELKKARQYEREAECARKELDREHRTEARKNHILNQAYKDLFHETDRVKYFNAAKNLAESLRERDAQAAARESQKNELDKYETQFLLETIRDQDRYHDEEREKEETRERNKKKNAENWEKQHSEVLQKKEKEKWEHLRDGYLTRDEAKQDMERSAKKVQEEKDGIVNYKMALDKQIKEKQHLLDIHERLEEVENEKARLFNDAKEEMELEHKKLRDERDRSKKCQKQQVANNLTDRNAILKAKERDILQKAVREADEKAREEDAIRQLNRAETNEAIRKFCEQEMAAKHRRKYEDRLRGYQERRDILDNVDKLKAIEDEKIRHRQNLELEAGHVQMHQIARRQLSKKAEEIEVMKDYMNHMRGLDEEEDMFQKYAQLEIEKCEARGIDTFAMKKAARPGIEVGKGPLFKDRGHIRPRYYASVWNPEDLTHMKRKLNHPDTKSRLGFILN